MKLHSFLLCIAAAVAFASCQKAYMPDGVVPPGTNPGSTMKLVSMSGKTRGSSEASAIAFDYDAAGRIIRLTRTETDSSNVSVKIVYRYERDAGGRVTKIVTNAISAGAPGAGLPDSVTIHVHYPSATSVNFDYTGYSFIFSGIVFADSTTYAYAGNAITDIYQYQSVASTPMSLVLRLQYSYSNGNIPTIKLYEPATAGAAPTLVATYNFEYDAKNQGLAPGNDAFLIGMDASYFCRNNMVKTIVADNTGSGQGITIQTDYQYNAGNYPVSGTQTQSVDNKTADLTFSYQ